MKSVVECLWPKPKRVTVLSNEKSFNLVNGATVNVTLIEHSNGLKNDIVDVIALLDCHQSSFKELSYEIKVDGTALEEFCTDVQCFKNNATGDEGCPDTEQASSVYEMKCYVNPMFFSSKKQSYFLKLEENIEILSSDLQGLNYAMCTLTQIIKYSRNGPVLPFLRIEDYPDFVDRGICISSFLNCLKPNVCNYFIDMLGTLRINQLFYELFIVDEQASNSVCKKNENISQIVSLQRICNKRFINVSPIYETGEDLHNSDLKLSTIETFVHANHRYFSQCKTLYFGPKVSKFIADLTVADIKQFMNRFSAFTICLSDVDLSQLPFGCGLISTANVKVPSQLYRKSYIESLSMAGNFECFGNTPKCDKVDETTCYGFILMESDRNPVFRTSVIFQLPLTIVSCGLMWNMASQACDTSVVVNEFMKHYVLNGSSQFADLGSLIFEISGIASSLQPHVVQLITSPDEVPLSNTFEALLKSSKQIRQIKNQLSTYVELENGDKQLSTFANEALFTCELLQFTMKLGNALCQMGRNPSNDKIGYDLVNLGIHNLPATVKTDLANRLITLIERLKINLSLNYTDEIVSKNSVPLYKLLENLIPDNSESQDSDFSISFDSKAK